MIDELPFAAVHSNGTDEVTSGRHGCRKSC
jgi:hypothetical protein